MYREASAKQVPNKKKMLNFLVTTKRIGIKSNNWKRTLPNSNKLIDLKPNPMSVTIITKEDLQEFKMEIISEIKHLLQTSDSAPTKKWLKSNEVRKLLNISSGTLQNLRINGTLSYTKIGGIMYYDNSDIDKLLHGNKVNALPTLFK